MISLAYADGEIVVTAQEAEVTVAPHPASAHFMRLPPLGFALRAAIRCAGDGAAVTFSVADTVRTIEQDKFTDPQSVETSLVVPPGQLALAASSKFCITGDSTSADKLLVPGFATVHASLHCENEEGRSVTYASTPLKLRLSCAREPDPAQVSSADR